MQNPNRPSRQARNNILNVFFSEHSRGDSDSQDEGASNNASNQEESGARNISPTRILLSSNWAQIQNLSSSERVALLNHIREIALIRHGRRMRFSDLSDEEESSHQEEENEKFTAESDIDFRTYPIKINWYMIENDEKDYFGVLGKYGYFGVAIYSVLDDFKTRNITLDNFLYSFLEFFSGLFKKEKSFDELKKFITALPSPKKVKEVIETKNFLFKEIPVFIIALKIFEVYYRKYDKPCYQTLVNDVINAQVLLGESIEEESWKKVYTHIKENDKVEKLLLELKVTLHKTKLAFIKHAYNAKQKYYSLMVGIPEDKFFL